MLQSSTKTSSINLARVSSKRKEAASGGTSVDKKSSFAATRTGGGQAAVPSSKPRVNASNNVNGDELLKVHGAEGGFFCQ